MSSGYNQGGFAPPPQGGYPGPGPGPGFGPQGVPPRPPAAAGAKSVPPVVIWIILGVTAINLLLTTYMVIQYARAASAASQLQEQLEGSLGDLGDLGGSGGLGGLGG